MKTLAANLSKATASFVVLLALAIMPMTDATPAAVDQSVPAEAVVSTTDASIVVRDAEGRVTATIEITLIDPETGEKVGSAT